MSINAIYRDQPSLPVRIAKIAGICVFWRQSGIRFAGTTHIIHFHRDRLPN
jgi:hypothetical protein